MGGLDIDPGARRERYTGRHGAARVSSIPVRSKRLELGFPERGVTLVVGKLGGGAGRRSEWERSENAMVDDSSVVAGKVPSTCFKSSEAGSAREGVTHADQSFRDRLCRHSTAARTPRRPQGSDPDAFAVGIRTQISF